MALSNRSGQAILEAYLIALGIDPTGADPDTRATGLAELNTAYRTYLDGVHVDNRGQESYHQWSFLRAQRADFVLPKDSRAVDMPADFGGSWGDLKFRYQGDLGAVLVDQGVIYRTLVHGTAGESVTLTIVNPGGDHELELVEAGNDVTITLEYDTGAIVTTTADLVTLVNAESALISAAGGDTALAGALTATAFVLPDDESGNVMLYITPDEMAARVRDWDGESDTPIYWTIEPKTFALASGSEWQLLVLPPPSDAAGLTVALPYNSDPGDLTDETDEYAIGWMGCERLIIAIAKKNKEISAGNTAGPDAREADRMFRAMVLKDQKLFCIGDRQRSLAEVDPGIDA